MNKWAYPGTEIMWFGGELHLAILIMRDRIILSDGSTVPIGSKDASFVWEHKTEVFRSLKAL